jgi:pimeloyl-ACP methyl ester carboxylesterase
MGMPEVATSRQEQPVFFPCGDDALFGVLTEPLGRPRGIGVILLYGGGYTMSSYYNQYWTLMARRVASLGFHALRFDHHGNGDSTGRVDSFDHKTPFSSDMVAAIRLMETQGLSRFILVGDCLGGRGALVAASQVDEVEGVFLISAMVRDGRMDRADDWAREYGLAHYVKRAFRPATIRKMASKDMRRAYMRVGSTKVKTMTARVFSHGQDESGSAGVGDAGASHRFLDPLRQVLDRGGAIHFVFGNGDPERRGEFEQARLGVLGEICDGAGARVRVSTVTGTIAAIQDVVAQAAIIDLVAEWVSEIGSDS